MQTPLWDPDSCPRSPQFHCDDGFALGEKSAVSEVVECSCECVLMLCWEILDERIAL